MQDVKPADTSGIERRNIGKTKIISLQQTVRTGTNETCAEE
jgi:hypothetical protein